MDFESFSLHSQVICITELPKYFIPYIFLTQMTFVSNCKASFLKTHTLIIAAGSLEFIQHDLTDQKGFSPKTEKN